VVTAEAEKKAFLLSGREANSRCVLSPYGVYKY
jgi:hypothetical protein